MRPQTRSFYGQAVQLAVELIVGRLDDALDLESLAGRAGLSAFHFHRVFRGMVGETPLELGRRLRMERAAWRLTHQQCAITEVAFDAGYETHEAFTRAFRACYCTSPTGFRTRKHPRIELAAACGVHFDPAGAVPAFVPRDSGGRHMDVQVKSMPELRVGCVRHVGPYNQIPLAFERLGAIVGAAGPALRQSGAAMIAIYHDDPDSTPLDQLRSDAGVIVPEDVPMPHGLTELRLPGGTYACALHVGPYEQLGDAWARLMGEWLPASGHRVGEASSYEIYLNDPRATPKEELKTEMYTPLAA
jgi:AraC family transcriptional regulator